MSLHISKPPPKYETYEGQRWAEDVRREVNDLVNGLVPNTRASAGTVKAAPGTVDKWVEVVIGGVTHYVPAYTSKA